MPFVFFAISSSSLCKELEEMKEKNAHEIYNKFSERNGELEKALRGQRENGNKNTLSSLLFSPPPPSQSQGRRARGPARRVHPRHLPAVADRGLALRVVGRDVVPRRLGLVPLAEVSEKSFFFPEEVEVEVEKKMSKKKKGAEKK